AVAWRAQPLTQPLPGGVEAVVNERPDARRALRAPPPDLLGRPPLLQASLGQSPQGNVVQRGHHQVYAEPGHFGRLSGLDAAVRVLGHEAVAWADAQLLRGGQDNRRVGLTPR